MSERHSIRGLPADLLAEVRQRAQIHDWPLTRTVRHLLRIGLDLDPLVPATATTSLEPDAIRALRQRLGENTETFGARFGRSGRTVESWEQDIRGPDALTAQRILALAASLSTTGPTRA